MSGPSGHAEGGGPTISASTGLVVLLGDPVGHSLSPTLHNAAFRHLGLDLVYLACAVGAGRMADAMAGLDALGAVGANVTIPHKRAAFAHAAEVSATAAALGAANTLTRTAAGWRADNTDVTGFLRPLEEHHERLQGADVVVLGAGGAARAVVYGAAAGLAAGRVTVAARRAEQAEALLADLEAHAAGADLRALPLAEADVRAADLVVNATPLGMGDGATPWADDADFHSGQIVYDLVYTPARTPLLEAAAARGATTVGGLPMLLGQAAAAFRQWTGHPFPLAVAEAAARTALDQ